MSSHGVAPTDDSLAPVGFTSDGQPLVGVPQDDGRVNYYNPATGDHLIGLSQQ